MSESGAGPKRSLLAQERSRDTRRTIIRAAVELWSERGFDTGVDETTVEEIAARAGVAKATFYLHFARKEDILLETGWLTAKVFYEDALKALLQDDSLDEVIDGITVKLCRRIERLPRAGLRQMLRVQHARLDIHNDNDPDHFGLRRAFAVVFLHAQQAGDIPSGVRPDSLGKMFEAQVMAVIRDWACEEEADPLAALRERFAILLAGVRTVPENVLAPGDRLRRPAQRRR